MDILGVIPAKGHSRRIARKNLALLGDRPLVGWTLEAAQASRLSRIVLSTDDEDIATYARTFGRVEVVPRLDARLSEHSTHAVWVVRDTLRLLYSQNGYKPDAVMMLLPTSPFRTARHIDEAVQLWQQQTCDAVIGVTQIDERLEALRSLTDDGYLKHYLGHIALNYQAHTSLYRVNGAIFLCSERELVRCGTFHVSHAVPYIMDAEASLEIDTPQDLHRARRLAVKAVAHA